MKGFLQPKNEKFKNFSFWNKLYGFESVPPMTTTHDSKFMQYHEKQNFRINRIKYGKNSLFRIKNKYRIHLIYINSSRRRSFFNS